MFKTLIHDPLPTTALTDGSVAYAIGDVHGSAKTLCALLEAIKPFYTDDLDAGKTVYLVFLGDYTDRGKNNLAAIDLIMDRSSRDARLNQIDLVGNHDMMVLLSLRDNSRSHIECWVNNGGHTVIEELLGPRANFDIGSAASKMGGDRLEWFAGLQTHFKIGNTIFVHAGINPIVREESLERYCGMPWKNDPDFAWLRGDFLNYERLENDPIPTLLDTHCVVHGHTPNPPTILLHRIGLDTGCFYTGIMTAVRVCDGSARFIQCYDENTPRPEWLVIKTEG